MIASANAAVIFSNLGPGDSFGSSGWVVGQRATPFGSINLEVAAAFTVTSDAVFTEAEFAAQLIGQAGDLRVALLATDPSGTPGSLLASFTIAAPAVPSVINVQSFLGPILSAGTEYWLDITSLNTAALWFDNNQSGTGPVAVNQNGQGFALITGFGGSAQVQPAFQIDGIPLPSLLGFAALAPAAVPEPSTVSVMAGGLFLSSIVVLLRRRLPSGPPSS
jgi:hypothetical protein